MKLLYIKERHRSAVISDIVMMTNNAGLLSLFKNMFKKHVVQKSVSIISLQAFVFGLFIYLFK